MRLGLLVFEILSGSFEMWEVPDNFALELEEKAIEYICFFIIFL